MVLYAPEYVSDKATVLIKEMFTNLGPRLQSSTVVIHEDFIQVGALSCVQSLQRCS